MPPAAVVTLFLFFNFAPNFAFNFFFMHKFAKLTKAYIFRRA